MRVPLDNCVPKGLRASLTAHDAQIASEMGRGDLDNGALLDAMTGRLDAHVTVDRRLPPQQRIRERSFAVVVLRANSNRLAELLPVVPELLEALSDLAAGTATEVGGQ